MIKLTDILVEDFQQKKNNFKLELRNKLDQAKDGAVLKVEDLTWTKVNKNWKGGKFNRTEPGQSIVDDIAVMFHNDIKTSANYDASDVFDKIIFEGTRCWKGYEKKGMKTMFGKRVPNCVKRENVAPDHDGKAAPYGSGYDEINEDPNETKGGLGKWFRQKWVDISRKKKGGGHPACGASAMKKSRKGGKGAYPKCVPASKARSMSKKEKESASRRKRSAYKGKGKPGKKPKNISTEVLMNAKQKIQEVNRLLEKSIPNDKSKWSYAKSQAKKKFDVYPSAYANAWAAKKYKELGGTWRKGK